MLTHSLITGTIFGLGLTTVILSVYSCVKFNIFKRGLSSSAHRLSQAISWQFAGEAVIGFGTLIFATAEFLGLLDNWNYMFTSSLRFTMFIATSLTTLHLILVLEKLEKNKSEDLNDARKNKKKKHTRK